MEADHSFFQYDISIHHKAGCPEDAANVGLF